MTVADPAVDPTPVIEDLLRTGRAPGHDGRSVCIADFAIRAEAGAILERATAAAPPGATVEVGCASGLSTLFLARGRLRAGGDPGLLHVIDPKQRSHWHDIGRGSVARAGLAPWIDFREQPAHVALPALLAEGVRATFAFIDGWHMLDHVMVEAFYCDAMLPVGGVIALHDLWMPALQHFACFWCANRSYEPVTARGDDGLVTAPRAGVDHECGDLGAASPHFRARIAPFVDRSVLLLRKTGADERAWDEFHAYVGAPA